LEEKGIVTIKIGEAKYIKPLGTYSQITTFDLPDKATAGQVVAFRVGAQLTASLPSGYPYFAVGVAYVNGPEDSIKLTINGYEEQVGKGQGKVVPFSGVNVGKIAYIGVWFTPGAAGKYEFQAVAGSVSSDLSSVQSDSTLNKTCEAVAAGAGGAGGAQDWTKQLSDMMNNMVPLMMTMMMLMMMMSMMSGMMRSFREGGT